MSKPRHKRKESYTVLVVSNMDRKSRQFHISRTALHVLFVTMFLLCAFTVLLIYQCNLSARRKDTLRDQLKEEQDATGQLALQWDEEREQLNSENRDLALERDTLLAEKEIWDAAQAEAAQFHEPDENPELPTLYPSSGTSVLTSVYTEDHPYITFTAERGSDIIASGNGTVTLIGSDKDHPFILELSFNGGFKARYLYHNSVDLRVQEGDLVASKDILFTITEEQAELDYQIIYDDKPLDPLMIIAAKG